MPAPQVGRDDERDRGQVHRLNPAVPDLMTGASPLPCDPVRKLRPLPRVPLAVCHPGSVEDGRCAGRKVGMDGVGTVLVRVGHGGAVATEPKVRFSRSQQSGRGRLSVGRLMHGLLQGIVRIWLDFGRQPAGCIKRSFSALSAQDRNGWKAAQRMGRLHATGEFDCTDVP